MRVIGNIKKDRYVCEVSHNELEKFLDRYGYQKENLDGLKAGDFVDLGKGYDFNKDALEAMKKTEEFIKANKSVIEAIMTGISVAGKTAEVED